MKPTSVNDETRRAAPLRRNKHLSRPMTRTFLVMLVLLFIASTAFSETPADRIAVPERSWPTFWRQFTSAIDKRDHAALLRMMSSDFFDGGGGLTPRKWLQFIDENERKGSWRDLQRSVAGGGINRDWGSKGVPTKVTRDNGYYFEFRKDGKWYFAGVVGD